MRLETASTWQRGNLCINSFGWNITGNFGRNCNYQRLDHRIFRQSMVPLLLRKQFRSGQGGMDLHGQFKSIHGRKKNVRERQAGPIAVLFLLYNGAICSMVWNLSELVKEKWLRHDWSSYSMFLITKDLIQGIHSEGKRDDDWELARDDHMAQESELLSNCAYTAHWQLLKSSSEIAQFHHSPLGTQATQASHHSSHPLCYTDNMHSISLS